MKGDRQIEEERGKKRGFWKKEKKCVKMWRVKFKKKVPNNQSPLPRVKFSCKFLICKSKKTLNMYFLSNPCIFQRAIHFW